MLEADGSDGGHGEGERQPLREPTCRRRCCQVAPAPVVRAAQPALHRAEARLEGKEEQYTLPDHASGAPPLAALSLGPPTPLCGTAAHPCRSRAAIPRPSRALHVLRTKLGVSVCAKGQAAPFHVRRNGKSMIAHAVGQRRLIGLLTWPKRRCWPWKPARTCTCTELVALSAHREQSCGATTSSCLRAYMCWLPRAHRRAGAATL
jgi:hypothetical protein